MRAVVLGGVVASLAACGATPSAPAPTTAVPAASTADASPDAPAITAPPAGYTIVPGSRSPDGAWQVLIPTLDSQEGDNPVCETRVVSVRTGALLTRLPGECFFEHQSQIELTPRWSSDSQVLVWLADNKWGSANVQILQLAGGAVASLYDARPAAEDQVLAAVRAASARKYAAARKRGEGNGAWFRDGFAIDVHPTIPDEVRWPIAFTIDITSDNKCMWPASDRQGGVMTATLDAAHQWTFGPFVAGHAACGTGGLVCAFSDCD
ncbi:MAG: hypothetical protein K8W52_26635 [Deltaproteobacteria bacterium]|nr:hypothetical protein [Deltaproteobacteria bacterium]